LQTRARRAQTIYKIPTARPQAGAAGSSSPFKGFRAQREVLWESFLTSGARPVFRR
jgi:hypothetical protein